MTMQGKALVTIDWGTTNRRIFLLDADGAVVQREADSLGVTAVPAGGFPAEMERLRARFGDVPFLLAGMIGSNRGWIEAPYVPCPVTIEALGDGLLWAEPGRTAIVPGACVDADRADVMRGEEVQLLGAVAAGLVAPDALLCLPGTHAKWARVADGTLTGFRTVMTGEMFALLRNHSLLAPQLSCGVSDCPAFRDGVRRGLEDNALLSDLFGTRAGILLGRLQPDDAASYVSGLLLGADLSIGLDGAGGGPVGLIGDPALTRLYAAALDEAGRAHQEVDGERAFLAGMALIAKGLI
jgi:2-dehydro-3-deoxygalactonokinase